jgi:drug/metabolite transporter (DMT)-like permease
LFIRYAQGYAPSLAVAAWRLTIATLVLAPVALTQRRGELRQLGRRELVLALVSGTLLAVHFASWITSLAFTSVASSVALVDTAPLWVALAAPLIGERIPRPVWLGLTLALAGGVWVALSDACTLSAAGLACPPAAEFFAGQAIWGDFLALVGAVSAAGYLLAGRQVRAGLSLISYIFLVYGMAALVLMAMLVFSGLPVFAYPLPAFGWFVALALIPQLLGHSSYNWALGYLPASYVSITLLAEPIGSTLLAWLLLDETPSPLKLAGMALILLGILAGSRAAIK